MKALLFFSAVVLCLDITPVSSAATPPTGNWTVQDSKGNVCIFATMGIQLDIWYTKKDNSTNSIMVFVPVNATSSGTCSVGSDTAKMDLTFLGNWTLSLDFQKDKEGKSSVKTVTFNYTLNSTIFPDVKDEGETESAKAVNQTLFIAPADQSYLCNSAKNVSLSTSVSAEFVNLRLQAFMNSTEAKFGDAVECKDDTLTNNIVPIVVGAALAALVVIVLIAYLISRNRNKRGYESV